MSHMLQFESEVISSTHLFLLRSPSPIVVATFLYNVCLKSFPIQSDLIHSIWIQFSLINLSPVQSFLIQSSLIESTSVLKARWVWMVKSPPLHPNSPYNATSAQKWRTATWLDQSFWSFRRPGPGLRLIILHNSSRLGCKIQSVFLNREIFKNKWPAVHSKCQHFVLV